MGSSGHMVTQMTMVKLSGSQNKANRYLDGGDPEWGLRLVRIMHCVHVITEMN